MHGGKRVGAGRKRGFAAKQAEEAREVFALKVAEEIEPIAEALINKAKMGDVRAAKELFDRAWGRPSQAVELEVNSSNLPIPIMGIRSLSEEELAKYAFSEAEREILEKRLLRGSIK